MQMGRHSALFLGIFLLALILLFSACGKQETANTTTQKAEEIETTTNAAQSGEEEESKPENTAPETTKTPDQTLSETAEKVKFLTASFTLDKEKQAEVEIPYVVYQEVPITLEVITPNGQTVTSLLHNTIHSKGEYKEYWDGCDFYGKPLPNGTYTLQLTDGKVKLETSITLKNKAHTVHAKLNQAYFYETQTLSLQYTIQEAGPLDIRLYTAQQEEVLTLLETAHQDRGEYTLDWDMCLADGSTLPAGDYIFYLSTENIVETLAFEVLPKTLVDGIYVKEIVEKNPDNTSVQVNYSVIFPSSATVFVQDQNGNTVCTLLKEQAMPKGDFALLWDLKDDNGMQLPNGKYQIVFAFAEGDFITQKTASYTIQTTPSILKDIYLKNTMVDSKTEKAVLFYTLTEDAVGSIEIQTAQGESIKTLYTNTTKQKGQHQIEWDLTDANGKKVPLGDYQFVLTFAKEPKKTVPFSVQDVTALQLTIEPNKTVALADGSMQIDYAVNTNCVGTVQIYDAEGNLIRTLIKESPHADGKHTLTWDFQTDDGKKVAIGSYPFYFEFVAGDTRQKEYREIYVS